MERNRAPAYRSVGQILSAIKDALKALEYAVNGMRPFGYSYYFDDTRRNRTGPVTGIVWAFDEEHARRSVGVADTGKQFAYEVEITPLSWSA